MLTEAVVLNSPSKQYQSYDELGAQVFLLAARDRQVQNLHRLPAICAGPEGEGVRRKRKWQGGPIRRHPC